MRLVNWTLRVALVLVPALAAAQSLPVLRTPPAWAAGYCGADTTTLTRALIYRSTPWVDSATPWRTAVAWFPASRPDSGFVVLKQGHGDTTFATHCVAKLRLVSAAAGFRFDVYTPSVSPRSHAYVRTWSIPSAALHAQVDTLLGLVLAVPAPPVPVPVP